MILDISRLLLAAWKKTPSGIERVEMEYARRFAAKGGVAFAAANVFGRLHILPDNLARLYIGSLSAGWVRRGQGRGRIRALAALLNFLILLSWLSPPARRPATRPVYLGLSHENLVHPGILRRFTARTGARVVLFLHDLIPISYPEYVRPGQARAHRARLETALALADAILVNSAATKDEILRHAGEKMPPLHVLPLGVAPHPAVPPQAAGAPYFLCLGTIEPRKNHLLLLHLWRRLVEAGGTVPRLLVVGRRGWENEMVLDMLERCPALTGYVEERSGVPDSELATLMAGARALLLPSFAEGYGLPVPEALTAGTPVICSDLPALREAGGDVPDYLDPLDGPAWLRAVRDYAEPESPRRAAQLARLKTWRAPSWDSHFAALDEIIVTLP